MQVAILLLVLILPLSGLVARRVPMRTTLTYAGLWLLIATILYVGVLHFT